MIPRTVFILAAALALGHSSPISLPAKPEHEDSSKPLSAQPLATTSEVQKAKSHTHAEHPKDNPDHSDHEHPHTHDEHPKDDPNHSDHEHKHTHDEHPKGDPDHSDHDHPHTHDEHPKDDPDHSDHSHPHTHDEHPKDDPDHSDHEHKHTHEEHPKDNPDHSDHDHPHTHDEHPKDDPDHSDHDHTPEKPVILKISNSDSMKEVSAGITHDEKDHHHPGHDHSESGHDHAEDHKDDESKVSNLKQDITGEKKLSELSPDSMKPQEVKISEENKVLAEGRRLQRGV